MNPHTGREIKIGVGIEDAGAEAPVQVVFSTNSRSFKRRINKERNDSAVGDVYGHNSSVITRDYGDGDWVGVINPDNLQVLHSLILGEKSTSSKVGAGQSLVGTHINKHVNTSAPLQATVYVDTPVYVGKYHNARATSLELRVEANTIFSYTFMLMGKREKVAVSIPDTVEYTEPDEFTNGDVMIRTGDTVALASAKTTGLDIKSMSLKISSGLQGYESATTTDYSRYVATKKLVEGDAVLLFDSKELRDAWVANSNQAMIIDLTGKNNIGTSTTKYSVRYVITQLIYDDFDESRETDGINEQTIKFVAKRVKNSVDTIQAQVVNGREEMI